MEKLTIEQKAKRFDEAIERYKAKQEYESQKVREFIEYLFPELKESEEEKIRKELIDFVKSRLAGFPQCEKFIAWLEKQSGQETNDDEDILQRFSFYSYKDEPNILYLSGLYVNEKFRNKGIGTKILEVANEVAKSLNCHIIRLKTKKGNNAESLYRKNGYKTLTEEGNQIWLEKPGEQKSADKVEPIVVRDFNSVFSREQIEEIDRRIEESQRLYNAKMRDAMLKVKDFPMTD